MSTKQPIEFTQLTDDQFDELFAPPPIDDSGPKWKQEYREPILVTLVWTVALVGVVGFWGGLCLHFYSWVMGG